jgi:hypothetical protein
MLVFLSWSGARSKALADFMEPWLGEVIQSLEPWVSSRIEKGTRWAGEVSATLERCKAGIILLTPENQRAPWLLFEAGAISKVKGAYVCTLLLGLAPSDVEAPLNQFQSTTFEKDDLRKLLQTLNAAALASGERSLPDDKLNAIFENNWPRLGERVEAIGSQRPPMDPSIQTPTRTLAERLLSVSGTQKRILDRLRGAEHPVPLSTLSRDFQKPDSEMYYRLEALRLNDLVLMHIRNLDPAVYDLTPEVRRAWLTQAIP